MPGAFSPVHILIVLIVALVVLGPTELPKVARAWGRALREIRALRARLDEEFQALIDDEPTSLLPTDEESTPEPDS